MNQIELTAATLFKPLFPYVTRVEIKSNVNYDYNGFGPANRMETSVPILEVECTLLPEIRFDYKTAKQFLHRMPKARVLSSGTKHLFTFVNNHAETFYNALIIERPEFNLSQNNSKYTHHGETKRKP